MLKSILAITLSYLLGSLPFAILIVRFLKGVDVRQFGSKNAGATNVYRVAGLKAALLVGLLDMAKGFLAVFWISRIFHTAELFSPVMLSIFCAIAVVAGHMFPIFAGFRGGKGVLAAAGAFLALLPLEAGLAFAVFIIVLLLTRYVSAGSISAAVFLCLFAFFEKHVLKKNIAPEILFLTLLIVAAVLFSHRSNISRLLSGTENKIGRKADVS